MNILETLNNLITTKFCQHYLTIIVYGSSCTKITSHDLDICIISDSEFNNAEISRLIELIKSFSQEHGFEIDEEIPYINKLLYTTTEVETYFFKNTFITPSGNYDIPDTHKSATFLSSEEMKKRLLLNILTTPHAILSGDRTFVDLATRKAWFIIIDSIYNFCDCKIKNIDQFICNMCKNWKSGQEGEFFLGYKPDRSEQIEYIRKHLTKYLPAYFERVIDISKNTNPYYPTLSMLTKITTQATHVCLYPEKRDSTLRKTVASCFPLTEDQVMMTNGIMEAINLLILLFRDKKTALITPTFWGYQNRLDKLNCNYQLYNYFDHKRRPYPEFLQSILNNIDYFIICNPNNPTLDYLDLSTIDMIVSQNPRCYFIIDETMLCFNTDYENISAINLINKYDNLIVMHSMSKISGMCSLRCGFIYATSSLIKSLDNLRALYTSNIIAENIFTEYFREIMFSKEVKEQIHTNFSLLISMLPMRYINHIYTSNTAFILVQFKDSVNTQQLENYFARHKIIVATVDRMYSEMPPRTFRFSATTIENTIYIAKLINKFFANGEIE